MFTYFKIFVFVLFPPAAFLIGLLMFPFPIKITKHVIKLCDAILFCQPHPYIPISLFWCILILSFLTFMEMYFGLQVIKEEYQYAKKVGNFDRSLARLMAEQRNLWISGSACGLWVILYRYRSVIKKYYDLLDKVELELDQNLSDETAKEPTTKKND